MFIRVCRLIYVIVYIANEKSVWHLFVSEIVVFSRLSRLKDTKISNLLHLKQPNIMMCIIMLGYISKRWRYELYAFKLNYQTRHENYAVVAHHIYHYLHPKCASETPSTRSNCRFLEVCAGTGTVLICNTRGYVVSILLTFKFLKCKQNKIWSEIDALFLFRSIQFLLTR